MRHLSLLLFLLLSIPAVNGQELSFEAGKTNSAFDYNNSLGESLDNLQSSNHTYLSLGYRRTFFTDRLFINLTGSYNEYGAIGSDVAFDNYLEWDLTYLGANLAFDYEFYKPGNFTFFIKVGASADFLIQGTQTLRNQVYNAADSEDFKSAVYFLKGGLGMQYKVSDNLTIFNQYMYGSSKAFSLVQGDLSIKTHNFGLGLLINISKNRVSSSGIDNEQLETLRKEMETNSQKLKELEANDRRLTLLEEENNAKEKALLQKEEEIKKIKTSISDALLPYKGTDLNVEDREGKVFISFENDIIFNSGSSKLSSEGIQAMLDLGEVLAKNPDISVRIEGHTDNVLFKDANITNRDLSLKRATAIVDILSQNENINPKNLLAAGIGEFDPIADNTTEEGRARNRRVEIEITPKFKKLIEIISN